MGESIMAASYDEDKMGESAASSRSLEVSVSFGRFENDSLSWEKFSSFSPNKYLEEVEKCATPGSVAMKKAYFEAHYKKIAARKAEQLEQEKQMDHESLGSNDKKSGSPIGKASGTDYECHISSTQTFEEGTRHDSKMDNELDQDNGHVDEPSEHAAVNLDGQGLSVKCVEEDLGNILDGHDPILNKSEEAPLVREVETLSLETRELKETPKNLEKKTESNPVVGEKNVKLDRQKESQKTSVMSKIRDTARTRDTLRTKKKPASPVSAPPQISTPKVKKMVPTTGALSTSLSSTKKAIISSSPKSKSTSVTGNKKVAPKSLHMSLSIDTINSDPSPLTPAHLTTTRKSFFMEKMKDKEIVKRVFKTFQNNFNHTKSSAEERCSAANQVPSKGTEVKVLSSPTRRKENARSFMDKKTAKAASSSIGLKSDRTADTRKELSKRLEERSNSKESKSTRVLTKSKVQKDTGNGKLRQSLNFKATPMSSVFRGQKVSRSPLDKEGSKTPGL